MVDAALGKRDKQAAGAMTLSRLKQCIVEGYPVILSHSHYKERPASVPPSPKDPPHKSFWTLGILPADTKAYVGNGHTVLAVGFEDQMPPTKIDA